MTPVRAQLEFGGTFLIVEGTYERGYKATRMEHGAPSELFINRIAGTATNKIVTDKEWRLIEGLVLDEIEEGGDGSVEILYPSLAQVARHYGTIDPDEVAF